MQIVLMIGLFASASSPALFPQENLRNGSGEIDLSLVDENGDPYLFEIAYLVPGEKDGTVYQLCIYNGSARRQGIRPGAYKLSSVAPAEAFSPDPGCLKSLIKVIQQAKHEELQKLKKHRVEPAGFVFLNDGSCATPFIVAVRMENWSAALILLENGFEPENPCLLELEFVETGGFGQD